MASPDIFSVPRRFDLFTVLVATTGYALLFTGLRLLDYSPTALGVAGGLFAAVAIGQAALQDHSPRQASMIAAIAYWAILLVGYAIYDELDGDNPRGHLSADIAIALVAAPVWGLLSGYFVGVLAAGVFLVSHHLRTKFTFIQRHADDASPWDDDLPAERLEGEKL